MDKITVKTKRLTVVVSDELHKKAKLRAYSEGKTIKQKVIELLEGWLG